MASSKRDFSNFSAFPGKLNLTKDLYQFETLSHLDDLNRLRIWTIFVRLINIPDTRFKTIDWDINKETVCKIADEYFNLGVGLDDNIIAEVWTENGISSKKLTKHIPTYIEGKSNEGRANERNVFQQALIIARSLWLKKKEKTGTLNLTDNGVTKMPPATKSKNTPLISSTNGMFFPMLAKPYVDGIKYIQFPAFIQPKLDGIRCVSFLSKYKNSDYTHVVIYTRTKKIFPSIEYLQKILYPYLFNHYDVKNNQSLYMDGELYKHGKRLQDISGDSRNESADISNSNLNRNQYHIYDVFYPNKLSMSFALRYDILKKIYKELAASNNPLDIQTVKPVETILVDDLPSANKQYKLFIKAHYEGAILRNAQGPYLGNADKTGTFLRSNDLVKMKQKFTDEFKVVGFTEGIRGKDKGAIIWICETNKKPHVNFNVTPKDCTYVERYKLFQEATSMFDIKFKFKKLTIEYEDLSTDNVPLRAKSVAFRDDYE